MSGFEPVDVTVELVSSDADSIDQPINEPGPPRGLDKPVVDVRIILPGESERRPHRV